MLGFGLMVCFYVFFRGMSLCVCWVGCVIKGGSVNEHMVQGRLKSFKICMILVYYLIISANCYNTLTYFFSFIFSACSPGDFPDFPTRKR